MKDDLFMQIIFVPNRCGMQHFFSSDYWHINTTFIPVGQEECFPWHTGDRLNRFPFQMGSSVLK
jgi:hypothetical protein